MSCAIAFARRSHWRGDRTQSTIWEVANLNPFGGDHQEGATGHGTQKPVELMRRPMVNHTARGQAVYDPFLGSGTTLMAAELTESILATAWTSMLVTAMSWYGGGRHLRGGRPSSTGRTRVSTRSRLSDCGWWLE
jgi:hypothetical protein